ncbi:MAG: TOBE domain-containing protein [Chloroflexi bacterium]|nr:TOBE domain-containing protein [Chloroflexota bacterium]
MPADRQVRVGVAAEMLGLSLDTLRRWESEGRLRVGRSEGGQRLVPLSEVTRLLAERPSATDDAPVAQSARNRFPGIVTRIQRNDPIAVVEIRAGPHRVVSIMTSEAVDELGLEVGQEAVGVVKATNVVVEVPTTRSARPASRE